MRLRKLEWSLHNEQLGSEEGREREQGERREIEGGGEGGRADGRREGGRDLERGGREGGMQHPPPAAPRLQGAEHLEHVRPWRAEENVG